jgi:MFS family permease
VYVTLRDRPGAGATTEAAPAPTRRPRVARTVVTLGIVSLVTDISSESVSSVFPYFVTTVLGLSVLSYGFLDGLYQGVTAVVRLLGGWLADRSDHPKWVAAAGYLLSALSRVGLLTAVGFGTLTVATTVDRLGKGLRTAPRDAMIVAASPPEGLGRAFGVHRTLDTAGALLGPLLAFGVLLVVPHDVHAVFVASFAVGVVGVAVLVLFVPDRRPRRESVRVPERPALSSTSPGVARPRGVRAAYLLSALLGLFSVGDGFLYLAVTRDQSAVASWFPLLFVGTNVAYMALAVPFGRLGDRVGRRVVFLAGHLALLGAYAFAGGVPGAVVGLIGTVSCLGAYYAATDGMLPAIVAALTPVERRTRTIAAAQTAVAVARFGSSVLFGLLWVRTGAAGSLAVFGGALVLAVAAAAVALRRGGRSGHAIGAAR